MTDRYAIKEIFNTLQGEGARAGSRAVFVRFSGCNLWSGQPHRREDGEGACARWCDTDFFKGTPMDTAQILAAMEEAWPASEAMMVEAISGVRMMRRWCVLTGGEPTLQLDTSLVDALHIAGWNVAVETNGTQLCENALALCDWVCVSPKRGTTLALTQRSTRGAKLVHEVKVVLPGIAVDEPTRTGWGDDDLTELAVRYPEAQLFVQPMDPALAPTKLVSASALLPHESVDDETQELGTTLFKMNLQRCLNFVMRYPAWRLGTQLHKDLGLP